MRCLSCLEGCDIKAAAVAAAAKCFGAKTVRQERHACEKREAMIIKF